MVFLALLASLAACVAVAAVLSAQTRLRDSTRRLRLLEEQFHKLTLRLDAAERFISTWQGSSTADFSADSYTIFQPPTPPPPPFPTGEAKIRPEPAPAPKKTTRCLNSRDLEAMIGGNWLSKLGVLILLIGLALFLGFSLTTLKPAGRVAIGCLTGVTLIGVGVATERRRAYRVLGTALVGGGWAALFVTTYAAHALEAARVIESSSVAFGALLLVALLMIGHSLHFKSQTVSGLAFAAAFVAIATSPQGLFAHISAAILLLSLLTLAWHFNWQQLATAGAVFAYSTFGLELASDPGEREFTRFGQPILWFYWSTIELFDILCLRRARSYFPVFLFNALGFMVASIATWPSYALEGPGLLLMAAALAYFCSGLLRFQRMPNGKASDRSISSGFRAALTVSAGAAVAAALIEFQGLTLWYTLALQAQMVVVAGWWFQSRYVQFLGTLIFVLPVLALPGEYAQGSPWGPLAILLLTLFYVNRALLKGERYYTYAAAVVLAIFMEGKVPFQYQPLIYTAVATMLVLVSRRIDTADLQIQAAFQAVLSVVALFRQPPELFPWFSMAIPAAVYYTAGILTVPPALIRLGLNIIGGVFATALSYAMLPADWLPVACGTVALLVWTAGLRIKAWPVYAASVAPGFATIVFWFDASSNWIRLAAILPFFLMMYMTPRGTMARERRLRQIHGLAGILLLTAHLGEVISGSLLTLAWGLEAAALLALGVMFQDRYTRLSALTLFLACMAKLFFYDFNQLDVLSRILSFIVLGLLLIGASWIYTRFRHEIRRYL